MTRSVDYLIGLKKRNDPEPVAALAWEWARDLNLSIISVEMGAVDHPPLSKNPVFFLLEKQKDVDPAIQSPEIWEVCIKLHPS